MSKLPSGAAKDQASVEIYALYDPRNGELKYIGKANNSSKRLKSHLRETRRNTPLYRWISELRAIGLIPTIKVQCSCSRSEWMQKEKDAIAEARKQGINLLNIAEGGNEPYCPNEVRAENGIKSAIARVSTPTKARIYHLKRMLGLALADGYVSEATKEKLRRAARNRPDLFGQWIAL